MRGATTIAPTSLRDLDGLLTDDTPRALNSILLQTWMGQSQHSQIYSTLQASVIAAATAAALQQHHHHQVGQMHALDQLSTDKHILVVSTYKCCTGEDPIVLTGQ